MKPFILLCIVGAVSLCHAAGYRIALLTDDTSKVFWKYVYTGAAKAQLELRNAGTDVVLTWDGPENDTDQMMQSRILERTIADKVSGIILSPSNVRTFVRHVEEAHKMGIPVVVINAGLGSAGQVSFISTNNYMGGVLAARKLGSIMKGKGNVVVFRWLAGNAASSAREAGFIDAIKGQFPDLKVLSENQSAGGTYVSSRKAASDLVKKFGAETNAFFTPTQVTTETMVLALREEGRGKGKPILIGFDSSEMLVAALREGDIQALVVQNPVRMGYLALKMLVTHLQGGQIETEVDTGCTVVSLDNIDKPMVKELLNPT
ncbi:MAG: substrate-binding domain-containing protein, partial [Opitutaceae bacterium]